MISGNRLSVGAPYFNFIFKILGAVLFLIIAPAAMLSWKRGDLTGALRRMWPAAIVALIMIGFSLFLTWPKHVAAGLGAGLAFWAGGGAVLDLVRHMRVRADGVTGALKNIAALPRAYLGMNAAHLGLAIVAIGVLGAGVWRSEEVVFMKPGEAITIGGYEVTLNVINQQQGPNYISERAQFDVRRNGKYLRSLPAERRYYPVRGMQTTEAGIWTSLRGDLYLVIGERSEEFGAVVRAWYNPFAVWLWIGAGIMALGGVIAATPRQAPKRSVQEIAAAIPEAAE